MFEQIVNLILEYVEPTEEITEDSGLRSDIELSSFDLVCISADIEGVFGVVIDAEDMRDCDTVGNLMNRIQEKQANM